MTKSLNTYLAATAKKEEKSSENTEETPKHLYEQNMFQKENLFEIAANEIFKTQQLQSPKIISSSI